jgi:hypothetical protein
LENDDLTLYRNSVKQLINIVDNPDRTNARIGLLSAQHLSQVSKTNGCILRAMHRLESSPNCKVVIAFNYSEPITRATNILFEYNPLVITGKKTKKQKENAIQQFQEPNLDHRVLIVNIECVDCGIDLDDKDGRFQRYVFVCPCYSIMCLYQFSCRFLRSNDTKTDTIIEYIYSNDNLPIMELDNKYEFMVPQVFNEHFRPVGTELDLLEKLKKKSKLMGDASGHTIEFMYQLIE